MTVEETQAIAEYEQRQRFLEPFRRITAEWGVETQHRFQRRIRDLNLVAEGDLESDWRVQVLAQDTGVVVAEFGFNEYGRYFDMRRVQYGRPMPPEKFEEWYRSKVAQGRIGSDLAQRRGLSLTDPRVIHDMYFRIARASHFTIKRRRWYNKGKEASINELYNQLREAAIAIVMSTTRKDLTDPVPSR